MRAYYFFMKFLRSFGIGFGCGLAASLLLLLGALAVRCLYFAG